MAVGRRDAICPPMDTCLSLIEEAMKQEECSRPMPHLPCSPAKGNPGGSKAWQEKLDCDRAEEKHKRMSSLGLVRTDLFPRIRALIEWRRRRRQRRQRQCKLGSPSAELQCNAVPASLPICNTGLDKKPEKKTKASSEEATTILEKKATKKPKNTPAGVPQSNRGTRGKGVKPHMATTSVGRRKTGNRLTSPPNGTVEVACNNRSPARAKLGKRSTLRLDKAKAGTKVVVRKGVRDDTSVSATPSMDHGKHQRKRTRPLKLPDLDYVFDSLQEGVATAVKMEKKSLGDVLTPSTSQAGELPSRRVLRARRPPAIPPVTKSNRKRQHMTKSGGPEATNTSNKQTKTHPVTRWSCTASDTSRGSNGRVRNCLQTPLGMDPPLDTSYAAMVKQENKEEELDSVREQEKDRLTNVLGLMKTVLLPRLGNLIGWRQKKRLRKPKPTNYSQITPKKPQSGVSGLSSHPGVQVSPSDSSPQSKVIASDVFLPSPGLRRSSRTSQGRSKASEAEVKRTRGQLRQSVQCIKTEQAEPVPVGPQVSDAAPLDRAKGQSKPPKKLLDSGFPLSVSQIAGGATAVIKKEEQENVDICLAPFDSREGPTSPQGPQRTLRTRRPPAMSVVKREREERCVSQNLEERLQPKSPKRSRRVTKSTRPPAGRAGSLAFQGPQHQAPGVQNLSHSCLQCGASFQDCDALIMHRLRHIEGKHWPCPLCSKKFFRMRNVRSHIRTHEPKLYKCRSCIVAGL